ncbi:MAG: hypothetical protein AVO39_09275 [delta proteobacterium MLS_D]|jgi:glycosyltransferase 2 family protein|nr:MAG: hypothetical protein AVO39_09275 [delta proteobacterium MLS_D]
MNGVPAILVTNKNNSSKSRILFYARVALSCAIIIYLLTFLDWERIKNILPQLRLAFIWQAFVLLLLSIVAMSVRWSILLRQFNVRQNILISWRHYMIGFFYGKMLPGVIGGDLVRLGLSMKQHRNHKSILVTSVFFERLCGLMVMLMISAVTVVVAPTFLQQDESVFSVIYNVAVLCILLFVLFFAVLKSLPGKWFTVRDVRGFRSRTCAVLGKIRTLSVAAIFIVLLLSFMAHFFDIVGSYYLAKAIHIDLPLSFFLAIMPMVYLVTVLPISLGGLGVREGALAFFLIMVGVIPSDAVLLGVLIYLTRIVVALTGGIVQFTDYKQHENLPQV